MSPEQAQGLMLDARSDLYSVGVMLFEMLTGNKPYVGNSAVEVMQQHVHGPRPRLPAAACGVRAAARTASWRASATSVSRPTPRRRSLGTDGRHRLQLAPAQAHAAPAQAPRQGT